jgi:hypothetical protein
VAAPEFVPVRPLDDVRTYESPPRRPASWLSTRPGDLDDSQPRGPRFGHPGPDQGYVLTLVRLFEDKLRLIKGEDADDVNIGCASIALKRASLFGRAPIVHDLTAAYTIFGFLDERAPGGVIELRRRSFAGVRHANHWLQLQRLVDAVPESTLRLLPTQVSTGAWEELVDVTALRAALH